MQIPGQAHLGRRGSVAKSLPMPMPAAMVSYRATDEDFEEVRYKPKFFLQTTVFYSKP